MGKRLHRNSFVISKYLDVESDYFSVGGKVYDLEIKEPSVTGFYELPSLCSEVTISCSEVTMN